MEKGNCEFPFLAAVYDGRPALMDDASPDWLTYGGLKDLARQWRDKLKGPKGLIFLFAQNEIDSVAAFLGGCSAGHAVALFDPAMSIELRTQLLELYRPEWIICPDAASRIERPESAPRPIHPDLSILLSTSGSTGSPKLVRLTTDNLLANAQAIGEVMRIGADDIACGHLPLHYSFGLSVIITHLIHGARVRLTRLSFTDRAFWPIMRDVQISHLPGVPFHFQIMQKLGYGRLNIPSVKSLAQAGGFLNVEARQEAYKFMESSGGSFYVMYGQTEASPRMSTLTHDLFPLAPGSVGTALPGCRVEIQGADAHGEGEVVFLGSNVMMGYANSRDDLDRGDELNGRLVTGDIGHLNDGDILTLTGRSKRFGKLYGLRVSLDEIETFANLITEVAVTQHLDFLIFHMVDLESPADSDAKWQMLLKAMRQRYMFPTSIYRVFYVSDLPRTERGKVDYAKLRAI